MEIIYDADEYDDEDRCGARTLVGVVKGRRMSGVIAEGERIVSKIGRFRLGAEVPE
jgi:hypothetical protein